MKQYKSEQVCTTRNHGILCFEDVSWAIRKGFNPFEFFKPIKNKISYLWIRAHGLLKHDITKAKDNDIISIGLQVKQLITAGVFSRKPVTMQAKLGKFR